MSSRALPRSAAPLRLATAGVLPAARLASSDQVFLAGVALALFFVADPFGWRLERVLITKHLPLLLLLGGAVLVGLAASLACGPAVRRARLLAARRWPLFAPLWPLLLLAAWIIAGSLLARKTLGVHNTFLGMGLYMLCVPLVARVVLDCAARTRLLAAWFTLATLAALLMVSGALSGWSPSLGAWHEMEALVIPLAVYYAMKPLAGAAGRGTLRRTLPVLFFLAAGLTLQKYTALLVLGVTLLWLWLAEWAPRLRRETLFRRRVVLVLCAVLLAALLALAWLSQRPGPAAPERNNQYRLTTYEAAWQQFRTAPLWGSSFTAPATAKFTGFDIDAARGNLPTHSDLLDLAAQGGLLALLLWVWAHGRVARLVWPTLLARGALQAVPAAALDGFAHPAPAAPDASDTTAGPASPARQQRLHWRAMAHTLACMSVCNIVVYAFNPIMLQPVKALLLWLVPGLLLGLALHVRRLGTGPRVAAHS